MSSAESLAGIAVVVVLTVLAGAYGTRLSRSTSDFYVASRTVGPLWNASAISGEYLSAASFLGVAGLILAYGADMLWFPIGYTAGYLILLVLVAAPLRRSGAYTVPDFAETRLESVTVRRVASVLVVLIGWLYLLPQLEAAAVTMATVSGAPSWVGPLVVAAVVAAIVLGGGMRSITFAQAFQYWLKLTALTVPAVVLVLAWHAHGAPNPGSPGPPVVHERTTVVLRAPTTVNVRQPAEILLRGSLDGTRLAGPVTLTPGRHRIGSGSHITLPAGTVVPAVTGVEAASGSDWVRPLSGAGGRDHPLYATWSLVLATFLGTMGLPHVLVRFYTNPDGRTARRTAVAVLGLLGAFYLAPTVYGGLARVYAPDLLLTGRFDTAVLVLPNRILHSGGNLLSALVAAGAFAAFVSTSSGVTVSVAGVISQDLLRGGVRGFRVGTFAALAVPLALVPAAGRLPVAGVVGLAFAVAASAFCPLLVLGVWWRRLTDAGALAGMAAGGVLATAAVLVTLFAPPQSGWPAAMLASPAAWTVPAASGVMVAVSLLTPGRVAPDVARTMVRLHTPEQVVLERSPRRVRRTTANRSEATVRRSAGADHSRSPVPPP